MMNFFYRAFVAFQRKVEDYKSGVLLKMLGSCGQNVHIENTCNILSPQALRVGDNTTINAYTTIFAGAGVTIGKNCLISASCGISSINHLQESYIRYNDDPLEITGSGPVVLGDNVWLGMNVCILPGVTIGDNSIIGAGSVVTKNVPSNEVWVGCPARFVKKLVMP